MIELKRRQFRVKNKNSKSEREKNVHENVKMTRRKETKINNKKSCDFMNWFKEITLIHTTFVLILT